MDHIHKEVDRAIGPREEQPMDYRLAAGVGPNRISFPPEPSGPEGRLTDSQRLGYDAVNLPDHYAKFKIEPVRFCQENGLSFLQASILKYVVRYNLKNGIEDLRKAKRCLDMLILFEQGDPDWWKSPT